MSRFLSIDVEADGPGPGVHSILSLGACVVETSGTSAPVVQSTFKINLLPVLRYKVCADTMKWWKQQPVKAWGAATSNPESPRRAMALFQDWVRTNAKNTTTVMWPVAFDWGHVNHYIHRFLLPKDGESLLGYQALDIRSFVAGQQRVDYEKADLSCVEVLRPDRWNNEPLTEHDALHDAIRQGYAFARYFSS